MFPTFTGRADWVLAESLPGMWERVGVGACGQLLLRAVQAIAEADNCHGQLPTSQSHAPQSATAPYKFGSPRICCPPPKQHTQQYAN